MPKSTRKTRSTTHSGKSQRVEVFIKKEEDTKTTYDNSSQHKLPATWNSQQVKVSIKEEEDTKITLDNPSQQKLVVMTTLDSTVKDEDGDTKILLAKVESEKDSSILQKDKRVYCEPCNKYVYNSTNNNYYAHHLHTESHKTKVAMMLTQPDEFDPSLHCNVCDKAFGRLLCYRLHLKEVHKMELTPLKPKLDSNISPNSDNADNHCDSCNWTYATRKIYRKHLTDTHKLIIPPKVQRPTPNPSVLPDPEDPNYYCKSCQVTYNNRGRYRKHLWNIK